MNQNELYHHGVRGMKWGVRRYQNKDGSLTAAGQKRYDHDLSENSKKKKDKRLPQEGIKDPNRWAREDNERAKSLVDATSRLNNDLKNANKQAMDRKKKNSTKMDLSKMTDQEMREQINRAILERQYNDMFNPQTVSKGRERANTILEGVGTGLAITSSALGIALALKELRG